MEEKNWQCDPDIIGGLNQLSGLSGRKEEELEKDVEKTSAFSSEPTSTGKFWDPRTDEAVDEIYSPRELIMDRKLPGRSEGSPFQELDSDTGQNQLRKIRPSGSGENVPEHPVTKKYASLTEDTEEGTHITEPDTKVTITETRRPARSRNVLITSLLEKLKEAEKEEEGAASNHEQADDDGNVTSIQDAESEDVREFDCEVMEKPGSPNACSTNVYCPNNNLLKILAIKESLENDGTLRKLRAEMRTKVINILNGESNFGPPEQPKEILLINELVREYLSWSGYKYTKSVFTQESGLISEPWTRSQLLQELGLRDSEESSKLSVLHGIISTFKSEMKNEF